VFAALSGGWSTTAAALLGTLTGMALTLPGFAIGFTGAGDVKLFGMIGALLGAAGVALIFVVTVLLGALVVLVIMGWRRYRRGAPPEDTLARYQAMAHLAALTRTFIYVAPRDGSTMAMRLPLAPLALIATLGVIVAGLATTWTPVS
jgi:Flp pilus assembly protein protease CpaA